MIPLDQPSAVLTPLVRFVVDLLYKKSTANPQGYNVPKRCGLVDCGVNCCTVRFFDSPTEQHFINFYYAWWQFRYFSRFLYYAIKVASAVAMLRLHTAATMCSSKRVSVTRIKFLDVISCGASHYQTRNQRHLAKAAPNDPTHTVLFQLWNSFKLQFKLVLYLIICIIYS